MSLMFLNNRKYKRPGFDNARLFLEFDRDMFFPHRKIIRLGLWGYFIILHFGSWRTEF